MADQDRFTWHPGDVVAIAPDERPIDGELEELAARLTDGELEELAAKIAGGSAGLALWARFLELAQRIADWQDVPLGTVVRRYDLEVVVDPWCPRHGNN